MQLSDEVDYAKADRADLLARLMSAMALSQFLLKAYDAFQNYGVDFKSLPEWKDTTLLDKAARLRPVQGQALIVTHMGRLENGLSAAIKRAQFKLHNFKPDGVPN